MKKAFAPIIRLLGGGTTTGAMFWFVLTTFLVRGIAFITTPIYTRLLTQEAYGVVNVYSGWYNIIMVIFTLSVGAQAFGKGLVDFKKDDHAFSNSILLLLALTLGFGLGLYFLCEGQIAAVSGLSRKYFVWMFVSAFTTTTFSLWQIRNVVNNNYKPVIILNVALIVLNNVVTILALLFIDGDKAFIKLLCLSAFETCFAVYVVVKWLLDAWRAGPVLNLGYCRFALRFCAPLLPYYLMQQIVNYSARLVIDSELGAAKVAVYSLGGTVVNILFACWTAVNNIYTPWLFKRLKAEAYDSVARVNTLITGVFLLATFLVIMLAPEVVAILAPASYTESLVYVPALTVGCFVLILSKIDANVDLYKSKTGIVSLSAILGGLFNIGMNMLLIPRYGMIAGAYVSFASYVVMYLVNHIGIVRLGLQRLVRFRLNLGLILGLLALTVASRYIYAVPLLRYALALIAIAAVCLNFKRILPLIQLLNEK